MHQTRIRLTLWQIMAAIAAFALLFAITRTFVGILGMLLAVAWIAISALGAFFILWAAMSGR